MNKEIESLNGVDVHVTSNESSHQFGNRKVNGLPNWLPLFFHQMFKKLFPLRKSKDDPNKCEIVFGVILELPEDKGY
jgi:hypothetical protein